MPKKKSWVWAYFEKKDEGDGESTLSLCKFCDKTFKNHASHFRDHLFICSKIDPELKNEFKRRYGGQSGTNKTSKKRSKLQQKQSTSFSSPETETAKQCKISSPSYEEAYAAVQEIVCLQDTDEEGSTSSTRPPSSVSLNFEPPASGAGSSTSQQPNSPSYLDRPSLSAIDNPIVELVQFQNTIDEAGKEKLDGLLARAIYCMGCPLDILENEHWIALLHHLNPLYVIPSTDKLLNELLQQEFDCTNEKATKVLNAATALVLQLNGWSDTRQEPKVNIVLPAPERTPAYFDSIISTNKESQTGEPTRSLTEKTIKTLGEHKFLGCVTGSVSNMLKAKTLLKDKFPHMSFWTCVAHVLQNLLQDIFTILKLETILCELKTLANEINSSKLLKKSFKKIQLKLNPNRPTRALKSPAKMKFGGHVVLMSCFVDTKDALIKLSKQPPKTARLSKESVSFVCRSEIWDYLEKSLQLTTPILQWIMRLKADDGCLSEVVECFASIEKTATTVLPTLELSPDDINKVLNKIQTRKASAITPLHLLCNILDLRYKGKELSKKDKERAASFLLVLINKLPAFIPEKNKIMIDFTSYMFSKGRFTPSSLTSELTTAMWSDLFWSLFHISSPLCDLVRSILTLSPTVCAIESHAVYSTYEPDRKNKSLSEEKSKMLTFIRHNRKLHYDRKDRGDPPSTMPDISQLFVKICVEDYDSDDSWDEDLEETCYEDADQVLLQLEAGGHK